MSDRKSKPLEVVHAPSIGPVITAPPVIVTSEHSTDYICGYCGVVLVHADEGKLPNLLIRCSQCGSYNKLT
jgi:predicted RNA-binding Zn-ribbon protein involved in translation (DUF1610 family)